MKGHDSAPAGGALEIAGRPIGVEARPLVVAEIGTAHGGELETAHRLIDAAAEAGAECAKFQLVYAAEIIHPRTGAVPLPGGSIALYERFRSLERDADFYAELKAYTERQGLLFLCTPFGLGSARILKGLGVAAMKVASPELNHAPLLRELRDYGLPIILSTGVSRLVDIEQALELLGDAPVALLHCVTAYPAPPTDYNLRLVGVLATLFGLPVGVSDHSLDPVLVPALASACGAAIIEKHITLSKSGGGLDDPVALIPTEFAQMALAVRRAHEEGLEGTIERLSASEQRKELFGVLGSGRKELASSERDNYRRTNRSLHAVGDIKAGSRLERQDIAVLRSEKVLRPGLSPYLLDVVVGRRTVRDIPAGEGIVWDDLLAR